jgi:hypothetical protein
LDSQGGGQSGLLMHIAVTESVSLCERMKSWLHSSGSRTGDQCLKEAVMVLKSVIELHRANSITQTSPSKNLEG